ncbi:unnamed protein product [Bemisia tabaci]|uniref:Uncharacterized protein n=1 Tax=Bemisia tabaci TaxID=7038 RepID=A0A9P0F5Y2_BEMTA|nr:unnamed protein product [Bemisia tabaci]
MLRNYFEGLWASVAITLKGMGGVKIRENCFTLFLDSPKVMVLFPYLPEFDRDSPVKRDSSSNEKETQEQQKRRLIKVDFSVLNFTGFSLSVAPQCEPDVLCRIAATAEEDDDDDATPDNRSGFHIAQRTNHSGRSDMMWKLQKAFRDSCNVCRPPARSYVLRRWLGFCMALCSREEEDYRSRSRGRETHPTPCLQIAPPSGDPTPIRAYVTPALQLLSDDSQPQQFRKPRKSQVLTSFPPTIPSALAHIREHHFLPQLRYL